MDESPAIKNEELFIPREYLSSSQIEIVKAKVMESESIADNTACFSLIDSFVRANGKADAEYEALFSILQNLILTTSSAMHYPERVSSTLPILFIIAYYDYLVLTGVMSEEDISRMQEEAMRFAMRGGPAKA